MTQRGAYCLRCEADLQVIRCGGAGVGEAVPRIKQAAARTEVVVGDAVKSCGRGHEASSSR